MRAMSRACVGAVLAALLSSCAVLRPKPSYEADPHLLPLSGGALRVGEIYRDTSAPLSYHAPTLKDVAGLAPQRRVKGEACQQGLALPIPVRQPVSIAVGWGKGAYEDALRQASHGLPAEALLYDVRADLSVFMILTVYRRMCVVVDAAVAIPSRAPAPDTPPVSAPPSPAQPAPQPGPAQPPAGPAPPGEVKLDAPVET